MADRSEAEAGPIEPAEVNPAGASASPPPMDSALGGAGRTGSGGGAGELDDTYALGWGEASAAAWTRLVSYGVADDLVSAGGGGGAGGPPPPPGHFLDACFLCRKPLTNNRDIFMYRGDIPFCTEECRKELIEMDEEMERKEATTKKVAQITPSTKDMDSSPKPPKTRAGSILAG